MSEHARYPSLKDKSVFITGGATGIGASLVLQFARQGARVGFIDTDGSAGRSLVDSVAGEGWVRPWFGQVNVRDVEGLQGSIDDFVDHADDIGVLINNVADDTRHDPLEVSPKFWRDCISVNLDAAFFASQRVIGFMRSSGGGSIINFSSINAILGPSQMPGYVSAKAALLGLTRSLAGQYGSDGIRVNAILPGWVVTERQLDRWLTDEAEQEWMKLVALKKRIMPDDVANLALFLGSSDSAMITGQHFVIDGGRT